MRTVFYSSTLTVKVVKSHVRYHFQSYGNPLSSFVPRLKTGGGFNPLKSPVLSLGTSNPLSRCPHAGGSLCCGKGLRRALWPWERGGGILDVLQFYPEEGGADAERGDHGGYRIALMFRGSLISRISRIWNGFAKLIQRKFWNRSRKF